MSLILDRTDQWDAICFPVEMVPLASLLPPDYSLLASDRQKAVVAQVQPGQKSILALQSDEYSLIPNALLRSVVDECFSDYTLEVLHTRRGEFSINLILPESLQIGEERIYKTLILNNSYSGKTPFSLQGTLVRDFTETQMRVSYYRQICSNGLMGWADDYLSLDEYLGWLAKGQPKKYRDAQEVKTNVVTTQKTQTNVLVQKKLSHKGLNLDQFRAYLQRAFTRFGQDHGLAPTAQVYQRLAATPVTGDVHQVIVEAGLPKMLARGAVERLEREQRELKSEANLWLVYNAVNFSLFNSRSSLTISERYQLDEAALHRIATLTL